MGHIIENALPLRLLKVTVSSADLKRPSILTQYGQTRELGKLAKLDMCSQFVSCFQRFQI